ncbi:MAG: ISL3 family transposase [Actinomycetota bacterium]|nr:ISL3 family transposase [Actinomycetota bacterium]
MSDATFSRPDLDSFCRLDRLGLTATGQHMGDDATVLACRVLEADDWCHECGAQGVLRDTVGRRLAHVPLGWRPTTLLVRVRRYACTGCGHVWRQDTSSAAGPRSKLSLHAVLWALRAVVIDRLSIARVAASLGVSWHTVNTAVLAAGRELLIDDPARLDGVRVIGVDEHCWRHPRAGQDDVERYVTVIIDLTPVRDKTGPARLLDLVPGRSKAVFAGWLDSQTAAFRDGIEVVAMDGFTGFKTAATEALPTATAVMDPFHVVALAGDALERCRQRVQQETLGHRGRAGDPLYRVRRALRTGLELLTDRQRQRLDTVFADDRHAAVEVTWAAYQQIVTAYRTPDRAAATTALSKTIESLRRGVPAGLPELTTLGRTLSRRATDVLAYFDRPRTSNGPTEAINGRLEHLRGTALGFRNLTNYTVRALLNSGGFRERLHRLLR